MRYLVAIHRPDDYNPALEDAAMGQAIDALNREMVEQGIRLYVGGLQSAAQARSLVATEDGNVREIDGPYLNTSEHVGGFWVLEAPSMAAAVAWGKKAVIACKAPVEIRQFAR